MPYLSVVIPVYKAQSIVDELVRRLKLSLGTFTEDYEIILVEDCGGDSSWERIVENCHKDPRVRGIRLSRNFGQHHAITAGLDYSSGDWIVVMDCDLQDRPEEIPPLYREAMKGYEIVFARRTQRMDSFLKRATSYLFYKLFSYLSGVEQDGTIANFGIYSRKVIDAVNLLREPMRAFSPMARWVGFKKSHLNVVHAERYEGRSSYNWGRLIDLGLNIALSYSERPLRLVIKLGLALSLVATFYTVCTLLGYFFGGFVLSGYEGLLISIWFLSGLNIFMLGVIGLYVGKIFDGIKGRPIYITDELVNLE